MQTPSKTVGDPHIDRCAGGAGLVGRIRAGDKPAEEELFKRYRRGIICILRQHGASQDLADDLFQETITIAIEKIREGELREASSLSAFVCSIAKNLAIAHFRTSWRMSPMSVNEMNIPSGANQQEELLRKEEAEIVRRVVSELSTDRDRQVIVRYYFQDEDKTSICEDLGLTSEHFSRVLYRALQRFKEAFAQHGNGQEVRTKNELQL